MQHIEQRIQDEERRARDERVHEQDARAAHDRARPRFVTFRRDDRGAHLTIHGITTRPATGWLLVICGGIVASLGFFLAPAGAPLVLVIPLVVAGIAIAAASAPLFASPRSTIRLLAVPAGFAVYTTSLDHPLYVGRQQDLSLGRYEWRGCTGVSIRVWNTQYWQQQYMGISHPDDLAAVEAFNAARGRR